MGRQRFPWPVSARHERLVRTAEEFANEQIIPAADRADECREFNSDLQDTFLAPGCRASFSIRSRVKSSPRLPRPSPKPSPTVAPPTRAT